MIKSDCKNTEFLATEKVGKFSFIYDINSEFHQFFYPLLFIFI